MWLHSIYQYNITVSSIDMRMNTISSTPIITSLSTILLLYADLKHYLINLNMTEIRYKDASDYFIMQV